MKTVHVHCERCGECVNKSINEFFLLIPKRKQRDLIAARINFECPCCGVHEQIVSDDGVKKLLGAGIHTSVLDVPMEAVEPYPDGPPFSHDDILDLHLILEYL